MAHGQSQMVHGVPLLVHERHKAVVGDVQQSVLSAVHVRHVAVVGGGGQVLVFLAGEDVNAHKVALGVAVLARLGGGHVSNLQDEGCD